MWTLAEDGNERAIDEFGARHLEHRAELLRRIAMVKGLRGEKKRVEEPVKPIPRFVPKEPKSNVPMYIVGALVLAAIGALAFVTTILLTPAPHVQVTPPLYVRAGESDKVVEVPPPVSTAPLVYPSVPPVMRDTERVEKPAKPGTLRIDHAPLLSVLDMISQTCGVRIDPAPGMPNPDVVINYRDMTAMQMLRDLGRQYSFTPLDQHDGSILVVPAVDEGTTSFPNLENSEKDRHKIGG
jgi:hypothetical protein